MFYSDCRYHIQTIGKRNHYQQRIGREIALYIYNKEILQYLTIFDHHGRKIQCCTQFKK